MLTLPDANEWPNAGERPGSPVFVLTASRSGSTLIRFLLDSHPDLVCPPETAIASACAALGHSWEMLENTGTGSTRKITDPISLSPLAAGAVRSAIDQAYGAYLRRTGKKRWCDKSLDTYQFADIIAQVYPDAQFICLYRHCMDVIASGVETCPWGVHRYGFDPFVAQYPGNSIAAIGAYWLTCTQAVMAFQEKHPERCHQLRYEDLVNTPEETAAAIFSFLDMPPAPDIARDCFRTPHAGDGPGDEKIWFTDRINADSVGRGVVVPAAGLLPPLRQAINETLAQLGYRQVEDGWNDALGPVDPRVRPWPTTEHRQSEPAGETLPAAGPDGAPSHADVTSTAHDVAARLLERYDAVRSTIAERWPAVAGSQMRLVVQVPGGYRKDVRLSFGQEIAADGVIADGVPVKGAAEFAAALVGSPVTWRSLLDRKTNLITEMTTGRLRCINKRDGFRIRSDEVHAVATLLGLAHIPVARTQEGGDQMANGALPVAVEH